MDDSHIRQMVAPHREVFLAVQEEKYAAMMPLPNRAARRKAKRQDASNAKMAKFKAERDELQRRLDAVVAMLEPGSGQLGHVEDENTMSLTLAQWNILEQAFNRAVAIATGREGLPTE